MVIPVEFNGMQIKIQSRGVIYKKGDWVYFYNAAFAKEDATKVGRIAADTRDEFAMVCFIPTSSKVERVHKDWLRPMKEEDVPEASRSIGGHLFHEDVVLHETNRQV